jgi:hypothetical protein
MVWKEDIVEANSSLTFVKEVKLLALKQSPREDLTRGKNQETEADISWTDII